MPHKKPLRLDPIARDSRTPAYPQSMKGDRDPKSMKDDMPRPSKMKMNMSDKRMMRQKKP
jgi:hypothetical protein